MVKYLYVYGDDYSAMSLEQDIGIKEAYKLTVEDGGHKVFDKDSYYAEAKVVEFGEVDPEFESFIKNEICDYDQLKSSDIYRID